MMDFNGLGIIIPHNIGIGDEVQFAHLPENYYKNYGFKLIDVCESWIFDNNPYVDRETEPKKKINPWILPYQREKGYLNRVQFFNSFFHFPRIYCRSPRLYKYEDPSDVIHNKVCLHVQGKSSGHTVPKEVIDKIKTRYANYEIHQIGAKDDLDCRVIDCRGMGIWDTTKCIATSAIFIGVNSGPMNIANCYPHINKKIIIPINKGHHRVSREDLEKVSRPLQMQSAYFGWVDYGWQYYNDTGVDIGITYSYNKI